MAFDWSDFLILAEAWAATYPLSDALARSAVSRAYYGAFHRALNYAVNHLGFQRQTMADQHRWLCDRLSDSGLDDLAEDLIELRRLRNNCDYDDVVPNIQTVVLVTGLELARQITREVDRLEAAKGRNV